jgi:L-ascorbate metabolism protein UlaG (beta-lactamase superfamily)
MKHFRRIRPALWIVTLGILVQAGIAAAEPPAEKSPAVCVHYLGHAAFVLAFDNDVTVLVDYGESRAWGLDSPIHGLGGLVPDLALYTHRHADHAGGRLPDGVPRVLTGRGVFELDDLRIEAVPGYERTLDAPDNTGFLFTCRGIRILHLGDCQALITHLEREEVRCRIRELYPGPYDLVLMPIGFVSDILAPAAEFLDLLPAARVVPMHYWRPEDKAAFLERVRNRAAAGSRPWFVEEPRGATLCLPDGRGKDSRLISLEPAAYAGGE